MNLAKTFSLAVAAIALAACASLDGLSSRDGGGDAATARGPDATAVDACEHCSDAATDHAARDGGRADGAHDATSDVREATTGTDGSHAGDGNTCATGSVVCSGSCLSVQADPDNCGGCGVTCGGTCALGRCVVTLANNQIEPHRVTADATYVYWANYGAGSNGSIARMPLAGGTPDTLASARSFPSALAVDATYVYWVESAGTGNAGSVLRTPIVGGDIVTLATGADPNAIAVDASNVYWTTFDDGSAPNGTVLRLPLANGSDAGAPVTIASGQVELTGFAIDGTNAYWGTTASGGAVMKAPLAAADSTSVSMLTLSGPSAPVLVAVEGATVYWTTETDGAMGETGTIETVPAAGGSAKVLLSASDAVGGIALDTTTLYWAEAASGGSLFSMPLAGGAVTTLAISVDQIAHLATGPTSLYWLDFTSSYSGTLLSLSPK